MKPQNYDNLPEYMVFLHSLRYQWHNEDPMYGKSLSGWCCALRSANYRTLIKIPPRWGSSASKPSATSREKGGLRKHEVHLDVGMSE